MKTEFLEQYFELVLLPLYEEEVVFSDIVWKDHGKVGADAWAHYFDDKNGREFVLIYEDFPGSDYLNDDVTHELIKCGDETSVQVMITSGKIIDNITGYFTLYAEKR